MTANNNHLLVHNSVCWQFGQGSATRFFCCSLLASAMSQKSSGSLVESSDHPASLMCLVVCFGCQLVLSLCVLSSSGKLAWASCLTVPKGSVWKLKELFNPRLICCTLSLLLCLLVWAIHTLKPKFKNFLIKGVVTQTAKEHTALGEINAGLLVSVRREWTIRCWSEEGRWWGEAEGGEKVTNNFKIRRTWIQIPLYCFLVTWSWRND